MGRSLKESTLSTGNAHILLAYVADLELEVDRLRQQAQFMHQQVRETLKRVRQVCADATQLGNMPSPLAEIDQAARQLSAVLHDLRDPPGYHPAHDQVIAIAVRPLIEQVFRWQQRLAGAPEVELRLELEIEHVEWFPARLRHILDNLLSNALTHRDPSKSASWVTVGVRASPEHYEVRLSDNGIGGPAEEGVRMFELFYRAAPARAAGLGVGLAVVKLLVEQSGGTLTAHCGEGEGSTFVVLLPRYAVDDFLL